MPHWFHYSISTRLCLAGSPMSAPQVSQIGNATLVEREVVTLPLDHAFCFELADVGPAAIEVHRQCRRADGCGLSGSRSGGDGRAIIGDGLRHRFAPVASR
jgi:hypothetical protein